VKMTSIEAGEMVNKYICPSKTSQQVQPGPKINMTSAMTARGPWVS
jgi:hypothetical protein